jgi:hypothetical protein
VDWRFTSDETRPEGTVPHKFRDPAWFQSKADEARQYARQVEGELGYALLRVALQWEQMARMVAPSDDPAPQDKTAKEQVKHVH